MGIYKNGTWTTKELSNYFFNYVVPPIYRIEPDGSIWLKVFHHNNPSIQRFANTDTFNFGVYRSDDIWFNCDLFNEFSNWEILLIQKTTEEATEQKFRWVQQTNPLLSTFDNTKRADIEVNTSTGYSTPSASFGGMYYNNGSNSYLVCNNNTSGNWFGAIGCWTAYNSGIPAYNGGTITTGFVDVYIRIKENSLVDSNSWDAKIKDTKEIIANDFIEI